MTKQEARVSVDTWLFSSRATGERCRAIKSPGLKANKKRVLWLTDQWEDGILGTRVTVAHMCHQAPSWGQSLDSSDLEWRDVESRWWEAPCAWSTETWEIGFRHRRAAFKGSVSQSTCKCEHHNISYKPTHNSDTLILCWSHPSFMAWLDLSGSHV